MPFTTSSTTSGSGTRPRHWATIARGKDRKSTRLNSSHPSISYAVFCLKKKKQADRLAVQAQLRPRQHLDELLQGADAAGQDEERVGQVGHEHLAGVHGLHDAQVGDAVA